MLPGHRASWQHRGSIPDELRDSATRMAMGARRDPATPIGWLSWRRKCVSFAGRTRSCDRPRFFRSGARPPTEMIVTFIDQHKHEFGAEPVCRTLTAAGTQIAPSTYPRVHVPPALEAGTARRGTAGRYPARAREKFRGLRREEAPRPTAPGRGRGGALHGRFTPHLLQRRRRLDPSTSPVSTSREARPTRQVTRPGL